MLESFDDEFEFLVNNEAGFFFELSETIQIYLLVCQVLVNGEPETIDHFFEIRATFPHLFL